MAKRRTDRMTEKQRVVVAIYVNNVVMMKKNKHR